VINTLNTNQQETENLSAVAPSWTVSHIQSHDQNQNQNQNCNPNQNQNLNLNQNQICETSSAPASVETAKDSLAGI
jgi:aspartate carbamoyltransferase regulatory subunit